jgi:radical SAM protein with 4Fe4S-binding SPASM domain
MANEQPNICAYPWQQMVIDLTGEVVPCCFWSGYANSGKPLGNTNKDTLDEIWNGEGYRELRLRIVNNNTEGFPCHECLAYKWSKGQYPRFTWPTAFELESGVCYVARLPDSFLKATAADGPEDFELLEDGKPLGPGKSLHDEIRRQGGGRFSVWGEQLYMSASDNSDPRHNGRTYVVRRGNVVQELSSTVADSASGQNIRLAYQEYTDHKVEVTAKPSLLTFISTADCNIDCGFCSQNKVRKFNVRHRPETEPDVLAHVPYLIQFIWHGGEPFLIKRFREFYENYQVSDNPNLTFGFTSNGVMITEPVLEQLKKFPRLNASVSMDSFQPESFERIRTGANYRTVLKNVLRMFEAYDAAHRVFAVGSVVMKSNLLELAQNLRFGIEHDLGVNYGPLMIYPVHERLNVFHDIERETAGWDEVLQEAREVVRAAVAGGKRAVRRIDPTGMVEALGDVLREARARYRDTVELQVHIEDPYHVIPDMRQPLIIFNDYNRFDLPWTYLPLTRPGKFTVHFPAQEYFAPGPWSYSLLPDAYDEMELTWYGKVVRAGRIRKPKALRIVVPPYEKRPKPRNIVLAKKPNTLPLIVLDAKTSMPQPESLARHVPPPNVVKRTLMRALRKLARLSGLRAVARLTGLKD